MKFIDIVRMSLARIEFPIAEQSSSEKRALEDKIADIVNDGLNEIEHNVYRGFYDLTERKIVYFTKETEWQDDAARRVSGGQDHNFIIPLPSEAIAALKFYVCYQLLSTENDGRQYANYYNLYNQALANIVSTRGHIARIGGGKHV